MDRFLARYRALCDREEQKGQRRGKPGAAGAKGRDGARQRRGLQVRDSPAAQSRTPAPRRDYARSPGQGQAGVGPDTAKRGAAGRAEVRRRGDPAPCPRPPHPPPRGSRGKLAVTIPGKAADQAEILRRLLSGREPAPLHTVTVAAGAKRGGKNGVSRAPSAKDSAAGRAITRWVSGAEPLPGAAGLRSLRSPPSQRRRPRPRLRHPAPLPLPHGLRAPPGRRHRLGRGALRGNSRPPLAAQGSHPRLRARRQSNPGTD